MEPESGLSQVNRPEAVGQEAVLGNTLPGQQPQQVNSSATEGPTLEPGDLTLEELSNQQEGDTGISLGGEIPGESSYDPGNTLYGSVVEWVESGAQALVDTVLPPSYEEDTKAREQFTAANARDFGVNSPITEVGDAIAGTVQDLTDTLFRGPVGGEAEALVVSPANLVGAAWDAVVSKLSGEEVTSDRWELHESLKAGTPLGEFSNNIGQFAAGWTGIGAAGGVIKAGASYLGKSITLGPKTEALLGAVGGVSSRIENNGGRLSDILKTATKAAKLQGKDFLVNTISFDAYEGNLANVVQSLTEGAGPGAVEYLNKLSANLAVQKSDGELEGRFKNAVASQFGDAAGIAAFNALKLLGKVKSARKALEEAQEVGQEVLDDLAKVLGKAEDDFEKAIDDLAQETTDESLDKIFTGGPPPEIKVVDEREPVSTIAAEFFNSYKKYHYDRKGRRVKAIEEMLESVGVNTKKDLDLDQFIEEVEMAMESNAPISLVDLMREYIPASDLNDIPKFLAHFQTVTKATTLSIKRYVSNDTQLERAIRTHLPRDIYESSIGETMVDAFETLLKKGAGSLSELEEAAVNALGLRMLAEELLPLNISRAGLAYANAKMVGDLEAAEGLLPILKDMVASQRQAQMLVDQIGSSAGRLLQTFKIDINKSQAIEMAKNVAKQYERKGQMFTGEDISNEEIDALAMASKELFDGMSGLPNSTTLQGTVSRALVHTFGKLGSWGLKVGDYSGNLFLETYYNAILSGMNTLKAVAWGNTIMKANQTVAQALGAHVPGIGATKSDKLRILDEMELGVKYMGQSLLAGWMVLGKGQRHGLDYTNQVPSLLSPEQMRKHLGGSLGDIVRKVGFNKTGGFLDKTLEIAGIANTFTSHRLMGSIDTVTRVSNQSVITELELRAYFRSLGKDEPEAKMKAASIVGKVIDDIIQLRNTKKSFKPTNGVLGRKDLEALDIRLKGQTDTLTISGDIDPTKNHYPFYDPTAPAVAGAKNKKELKELQNNDRWFLNTINQLGTSRSALGPIGPLVFPFVRPFANSIQQAWDMTPGVGLLGPNQWGAFAGERGRLAQQTVIGQQILGMGYGLLGVGLAAKGYISPPQGSPQAESQLKEISGKSNYTLSIPHGNRTLNVDFSRQTPIADAVMIPGHMYTLSQSLESGEIDPQSAAYMVAQLVVNAGSSERFFQEARVTLGALTDPDRHTADVLARFTAKSLASGVPLAGSRVGSNIQAFTDPYYREAENYHDTLGNVLSQLQSRNPQTFAKVFGGEPLDASYDKFGNPRPRADYVGDTEDLATSLTRLLTPVGIRWTSNDPLSKELERFGKLGQYLPTPQKRVSFNGMEISLDQFKNSKGESLWTEFNRQMREARSTSTLTASEMGKIYRGQLTQKDILKRDAEGVTLREWMNDMINSDIYKNDMSDNRAIRLTKKSQVLLGTRWQVLRDTYNEFKQRAKDTIFNSEEFIDGDYRDSNGHTVKQLYDQFLSLQGTQLEGSEEGL